MPSDRLLALPDIPAPQADKRPTTRTIHGIDLHDAYAWLRAENWQEVMRSPEVLASDIRSYLDAENSYAEKTLAPLKTLQQTLLAEMRGRIKEDDSSVPARDGAFSYATRYRDGGQHPIFVRHAHGDTQSENKPEETVLLDGDALAKGSAYFRLAGAVHSPDHRYLAWSYDDKGSEKYTLRIRDLAADVDLAERIVETSGAAVWSADGLSLFYTKMDDNHRPSRVYRHELGTSMDDDVLLYEETDPGFFVSVDKTQSGRFLIVDCHDHQTSEAWLLDLNARTGALTCIAPREAGHEYSVEHQGERLLFLTNKDGAEDFKIMSAPLDRTAVHLWEPFVPHEPGRLILGILPFEDYLICLERKDGLPRLRIEQRDGTWDVLAFDEPAYALGIGTNLEFSSDTLRIGYSSPTTPQQTVDVDLQTGQRIVRKTQLIPSGHNPEDYKARRLFAQTADGEQVPITLLTRADHEDDGNAPCLLYGYGAYGISMPASFSVNALSLVDRGFVYAIAHIRGGKDKGFAWYRNGRAEHKQNTFYDFLAARDFLTGENIVSGDKVIAQGGSAGGMLMGAIANIAPERFAGIIAQVPFVDVLNTMLDDTLPLTPPEWPEWGNPIEDKAAFIRIQSYSPYDAIRTQSYPAIFALAGLTDPRVTYWEPAKWVARLREHTTGDAPILLKTNMDAGHGGAAGRFDRLGEIAEVYAFALAAVGINAD